MLQTFPACKASGSASNKKRRFKKHGKPVHIIGYIYSHIFFTLEHFSFKKLGAEFYHIDTTWADDNNKDGVLYSYFGLDEEDMSLTHTKDDLFDYPDALGVEYDYFRREGLYLEAYSFNKYNAIFSKNYSGGEFSVKFPSEVALRAAVKDIIENSKFYKLDGMSDAGVFSYVVDDIHCILTLYP